MLFRSQLSEVFRAACTRTAQSIIAAVTGELNADAAASIPIQYFVVCTVVKVRLCTYMQLPTIASTASYSGVLYVHTWSMFLVPKHVTLHLTVQKHSFMLDLSRDPDLCHFSV